MVKQLRNEGITLDDWILGTSTGMAEYSKLLRGVANPSSNLSVKRLLGSAVEVTKELGRSVKSELKLQVHRDLLEMSLQAELSGNAVLGLQRILKLKPADAAELVRALKQSPKLADSRLALLGTLDESLFGTAINKLGVRQVLASQPLADFMSLAGAGEARFLIEVHFRNSLRRFEEWSLAFNALAKDAQAIVLGVIRRHGFNVHPGVVTQLVKSGLPITPELLGAFGRIRRVLGEGMQFDRLNLVLQDAAKTNAADVARLLSSHATVKDAAIRNLSKLAQEGSSFGTVASRVNDLDTLMGLFERSRFDPDVLNSIVPQVWPRPGQALTAAERQGLERLLAAGSASGRRAAVAEKLRQVPADPQVKSQVLDVIGSATDEQVGLALRSDAFESFARAPTKQKLVEIAKPIKKTAPTAKPDIPIKPVDAAAVIAKAKASGLAGAESQFLDSVGAKLVNDLSQSVPKKTIEKYVTGTDVQRRGIVGWLKGKVQEAAFTLSDQFREIRAKIRTRHKELREELSNQDVQLGPLSFGRVGDNFGELTDGIFAAIGTHAKSGKRVLYVFSIFEMKSASNMRDLVNVVEIGGGSVPRVAGKTPARTSDPTLSGQVQKSRNRLDSGWSSFRDRRRRFDASEDEIELVILGEVGQKVRSEMYVVTPAGAHSQRQLTLLREQLLTQGMRVEMTTSPLSNDTYGNIAKWIVESMAGLL